MPVLVSAMAHDWVFKTHNITEDGFKAALFAYKIYEDPTISQFMQMKQFELMQACGMGYGMPGMMPPGMMPPGAGAPMGGLGMGGGYPGMFGGPM